MIYLDEDPAIFAGFGTALKPANEPIVLARKPLSEKTVAKNVLKWGTGALNIDGSRIGTEIIQQHQRDLSQAHGDKWAAGTKQPALGITNTTVELTNRLGDVTCGVCVKLVRELQ